jgi:hypothetical protein
MPRATARRKDVASIQFCGDCTNTVDTLRAQVVDDAPQVRRAAFCVCLYSRYSLFVPYLFALERSRAIWVTKLHSARLSGCKSGLSALAN